MNPETIIAELRRINAWRRGDETIEQPDPTHMGEVLDAAAESLSSLIASNTTLRRERNESEKSVEHLKEANSVLLDDVADLRAELTESDSRWQSLAVVGREVVTADEAELNALRAAIAELAGALRKIAAQKPEKPDYWTSCGQCDSNIEDAKEVLARHAAGEHCEDCDPSFSCWSNGSQCRKHAAGEPEGNQFTVLPDADEEEDRGEVQP